MNSGIVLRLLAQVRRLHQHERWTRQQITAHQAAALARLRTHAYAHSPFYRQFHRGCTDRPLHDLPVLTKALLMEHFDELVTDRRVHLQEVEAHLAKLEGNALFLDHYWATATSGSSGQRGIFLFDRAEWVTILASFARGREWSGLPVDLTKRVKMAIVASTTPWHMSTRVGATVHSGWVPELRLSASDPLDSIVQRLNAWQPDMLVAYASMARILAAEQQAGRLQIAPRRLFTSSEVLTDAARRLIEREWGQIVFNNYGATETGGIAAECDRHQGLHLFEDLHVVEVVDGDNRLVPPGVYGDKVLVTSLFSWTLPLIRYELSDSIRLAAKLCTCGRAFALIDGIQGRVEDEVQLPAATGGRITIHPLVFHQVMDTVPVSGWQINQVQDELRVLLSGARAEFDATALVDALRHALAAHGASLPTITVQRVAAIPKRASGKAPLIVADRHATDGVSRGAA